MISHIDAIIVPFTLFFDRKVDNGSLSRDLRGVVGVTHLGGDVESEVRVVLYLLVSHPDHTRPTWDKETNNLG